MRATAYAAFVEEKNKFAELVHSIKKRAPWLADIQNNLRTHQHYNDYTIETPVVYNLDLDTITKTSDIPFILVADNPGKNEQKACNQRYLVGQSGKLAASWFARELNMDFRASTIIINKTPVHTPKTAELRLLLKLAGPHRNELALLLEESQRAMARISYCLHAAMGNMVWVSGYGELGPRGLFSAWSDETIRLYAQARKPENLTEKLLLFRHFSMNQFSIEYNATRASEGKQCSGHSAVQADSREDTAAVMARLVRIGTVNRKRIFGF